MLMRICDIGESFVMDMISDAMAHTVEEQRRARGASDASSFTGDP